jgi:hypothetical protein
VASDAGGSAGATSAEPFPNDPVFAPSGGNGVGCLNCEWKLTARGYENYVPLANEGHPEAFFALIFALPQDLTFSVVTFEVVNPNPGDVLVKAFAQSQDGNRLRWSDGGEMRVRRGDSEQPSVAMGIPAWQETGYDPARIVRVGLSLRPEEGSVGDAGTATVIVRGWHFDRAE